MRAWAVDRGRVRTVLLEHQLAIMWENFPVCGIGGYGFADFRASFAADRRTDGVAAASTGSSQRRNAVASADRSVYALWRINIRGSVYMRGGTMQAERGFV
jgi:hypothetical protein